MSVLALTGGTGFVGSHTIDVALVAGHAVRALARRPQPPRDGVTWIAGALDDRAALAALVGGSDAVIHIAGVVNSPDAVGFTAGNIAGTAAVIAAAEQAGVARFVHVSSLAAREPALSTYGWSKAEAERLVEASALDWTIVRPPAIFGPRDTEMRELFRIAKRGVMPLPPAGGRLSMLYAPDLARLLVRLATRAEAMRAVIEPDDGTPGGWDQRDMARAIGRAVGRRVLPIPLPRALLASVARIDGAIRGARAKLTPDRVAYFCHPDWTSHLPMPGADQPTPTAQALAETAAWYRAHGLL